MKIKYIAIQKQNREEENKAKDEKVEQINKFKAGVIKNKGGRWVRKTEEELEQEIKNNTKTIENAELNLIAPKYEIPSTIYFEFLQTKDFKSDVIKNKGKSITYKGEEYQIGDYEAGGYNLLPKVYLTQYGHNIKSLSEKEFYKTIEFDSIFETVSKEFNEKNKDFFNIYEKQKSKQIENLSKNISNIQEKMLFSKIHSEMLKIRVEELKEMVKRCPNKDIALVVGIRYFNYFGNIEGNISHQNLYTRFGIGQYGKDQMIYPKPEELNSFIYNLHDNSKKQETYMWIHNEDGSGCLKAPNGKKYFQYDPDANEVKITEDSNWIRRDELNLGDKTFTQYAEDYILENNAATYISFETNGKNIEKEQNVDESKRMNNNSNKFSFILEKLSAAGIEVVTDKAEFDRILKSNEILQKMAKSLSELEDLKNNYNEIQNKISQETEDKNNLLKQESFVNNFNFEQFSKDIQNYEKLIPVNQEIKFSSTMGYSNFIKHDKFEQFDSVKLINENDIDDSNLYYKNISFYISKSKENSLLLGFSNNKDYENLYDFSSNNLIPGQTRFGHNEKIKVLETFKILCSQKDLVSILHDNLREKYQSMQVRQQDILVNLINENSEKKNIIQEKYQYIRNIEKIEARKKIDEWLYEAEEKAPDLWNKDLNFIKQYFLNDDERCCIGILPEESMELFSGISDYHLYADKSYVIDHYLNRHSDNRLFENIQNVLDTYSNIYFDTHQNSIAFVKKYGSLADSVFVKNNKGKIVLFASTYNLPEERLKNERYKKITLAQNKKQEFNMSLEGSTPLSQNPVGNTAVAISDVNDETNIPQNENKSSQLDDGVN